MPSDKMHQLTYLGALLYIVGTFLPLISLPVVGDISYYDVDNMSAIMAVVLAALAPALIFLKKAKGWL